jgi:hypothetical protein
MRRAIKFALFIAGLVAAATHTATANTLWTLTNVVFNDGGSATGYFVTDGNMIVAASIITCPNSPPTANPCSTEVSTYSTVAGALGTAISISPGYVSSQPLYTAHFIIPNQTYLFFNTPTNLSPAYPLLPCLANGACPPPPAVTAMLCTVASDLTSSGAGQGLTTCAGAFKYQGHQNGGKIVNGASYFSAELSLPPVSLDSGSTLTSPFPVASSIRFVTGGTLVGTACPYYRLEHLGGPLLGNGRTIAVEVPCPSPTGSAGN